MRPAILIAILGALIVAACGSTEKTTVVAPPGSTVVVPHGDGSTSVVTP